MKKNVLVFPCGSEIGLEIYKSLHLSTHFTLYGGSSVDDHGRFVFDNYIPGLPGIEDYDFIEKLNKVVEQYNIDYIFPAHDSVVVKLSIEKENNNIKCAVVTSPSVTCKIARSKLTTYRTLQGIIPTPKLFNSIDDVQDVDFPIFLKPDIGQGSKGTYKATNRVDVDFYCQKDPSLLLLEYLPGKEYTIDCFTDHHGKLLFCEGRERRRVSNGISVNSARVHDLRFKELAEKINKTLTFHGVWFFQVKERATGELTLLEVAPRVAGTMGLVRGQGVNLPLLSLFSASGIKVSIFENNYEMEIDRALENKYKHNIRYSHIYIDFDDLIIVDDKVNPQVMRFIFQSINENIKIHLLTRHLKDIQASLKKYRIAELFDEVIWVKEGEHKSAHIKEAEAIFIDDSFSEREEVASKKHIPVFDGHMIESLIK